MSVPLYQARAEFFRMLGHPVRARVLELLQDGPMPARELPAAIEVGPSSLSQQLVVLRRSGVVTSRRERPTAVNALTSGDITDLTGAARRIRTRASAGRNELPAELLRDAEVAAR